MITALLILHSLVSVALLGAVTHQLVSLLGGNSAAGAHRLPVSGTFVGRYSRVSAVGFTTAVVVLYVINVVLGILIYPTYRLDVRIPFEEMSLSWAVGLFEIKEHWGGVGLGMLPLYVHIFRPRNTTSNRGDRIAIASMLALIIWGDFVAGHVLNNIRGL